VAATHHDASRLARARSGSGEQVFMITGFGVHDRTDWPFMITGMCTSRSSSLIRSRSSLVGPAGRPRSRSAWRTQPRSVSPVQPIFAAIEPIAAYCEA
jgi:hypothetical protein